MNRPNSKLAYLKLNQTLMIRVAISVPLMSIVKLIHKLCHLRNLNMNLKLKVACKTRSFLNNYNKRQRQFKYNFWIFFFCRSCFAPA